MSAETVLLLVIGPIAVIVLLMLGATLAILALRRRRPGSRS